MAALALLALALFAGSACSAPRAVRIVGGNPTTIDKYPSIVQVENMGIFSGNWAQSCAANILTTRYVLSAAHCFAGILYSPTRRRIRAGATYRNTGGVNAYILIAYNHPAYGTNVHDSDISVVLLRDPLEYSPVIQQATIVNQGFNMPDNLPVVHAGWGLTENFGDVSEVLQDVTIFTINRELCAERFGSNLVTENMICAGILDVGGKDACHGDSGGPMYYNDILIGVVAWGSDCADPYHPGVSTRVASFTDWIVSIVN